MKETQHVDYANGMVGKTLQPGLDEKLDENIGKRRIEKAGKMSAESRNKCLSCGAKGRRTCPTLDGPICAICCGSKRGTDIICQPECPTNPFGVNSYDLWLRLDRAWTKKVLDYVTREVGHDEFWSIARKNTLEERGSQEEAVDFSIEFIAHVILFVHPFREGKTLVEHWEQSGSAGLNNDERVMMRYRRKSFATIIEIQRIIDHQAMECIDVFDPKAKPFVVYDRSTASDAGRFDRLLTWVCHYPNFSRLGPMALKVSHHMARGFKDEIRAKAKEGGYADPKAYLFSNFPEAYRLLTEIHEGYFKSMMRSVDSDHCVASYDLVANHEYVEAVLLDKPDFRLDDPDESAEEDPPGTQYFTWLRKGESKRFERQLPPSMRHRAGEDTVGVLGNIRLEPRRLIVETLGRKKFAFAKKMIDKYFGEKLIFDSENVVNLAKRAAEEAKEGKKDDDYEEIPPARENPGLPPEVERGMLESYYQGHYEKMIDEAVPMLGNLTPREAAESAEMREQLIEFMKLHLNGIEQTNREKGTSLSLDWMCKELGLKDLL